MRRASAWSNRWPKENKNGVNTRTVRMEEIVCAIKAALKSQDAFDSSSIDGRVAGIRARASAFGLYGRWTNWVVASSRIWLDSLAKASILSHTSAQI